MIFEHRCYTLRPGTSRAFWDAQVVRGPEPMKPVLDRLVGYFASRSGAADQVVHLYRYDSFDDWQTRVHGLQASSALQPYFKAVRPLMLSQENKFFALAPIEQLNPLWGIARDWLPSMPSMPSTAPAATPFLRTALVEESVQYLVPGAMPALWDSYARCDLGSGSPVIEHLVACFQTLVGRSHQIVHYRSYPDLQARDHHLARLDHDVSWRRLVETTRPLTTGAENKWLRPAPLAELSPLFCG